MKKRDACTALAFVAATVAACAGSGSNAADANSNDASGDVAVLATEPAGAPTDPIDGRYTCLGQNTPKPPDGSSLELTGYVRTLADPEAKAAPPAAKVQAFTSDGVLLGAGFADASKAGRVSVTVPVEASGFTGYALVAFKGYLDWRFQSSRAVTNTDLSAWAWLTTLNEATQRASALGLTLDPGRGIVAGAVHDCDGFGTQYVVVEVAGSTDGVRYVEGFDIAKDRTFTSDTGRFVAPNVAPGPVSVRAFGRLAKGGPLTLLSSATITVEAGKMSAVDLEPRIGND